MPDSTSDIAADEAGFPIDSHKRAFAYAIKKDIPRTAHAGEAKGGESVWETIQHFKPQRIGHGVRCIEDEDLVDHLIESGIHLEVCPTCNVQTGIFAEYARHPIDFLYRRGVSVGINTDARSLVNVSLTDEYARLNEAFDWGAEHFFHCNLNSLAAAFAAQADKERLAELLRLGYSSSNSSKVRSQH